MKKLIGMLAAGLMVTTLVACGGNKEGNGGSKTVATDGSTSMEKVIGILGEAFSEENRDVKFTYNPTGSGSGIAAVAEGRTDIGLSSRELKEEEKERGLEETVLAFDGIAVILNKDNPVTNLTMEEVEKIYKGEITNWKEVGGQDLTVVVIGREAGSGTRDGFESVMKMKVQLNLSRLLSGEERIGTAIIIFDVSERALAEKSRREFSANVSHELKTPL